MSGAKNRSAVIVQWIELGFLFSAPTEVAPIMAAAVNLASSQRRALHSGDHHLTRVIAFDNKAAPASASPGTGLLPPLQRYRS